MRQLVQLQQRADDFQRLNAELVFVYREESEGVEGLKKIKQKTKSSFRLSLDFQKQSSGAYSPKPKTFDNYVVDSTGIIRGIVPGRVPIRATADQLIQLFEQIEETKGN